MAYADQAFRARVDSSHPVAFAVCDGCGGWYNRPELKPQMEYRGDALQWTGYLYCYRCISQPQSQLLTPVLPEDPTPVDNPRVEYFIQDQNLNGFTQINGIQQASIRTMPQAALLTGDRFEFINGAQLLASSQTGWGLPQPNVLVNRAATLQFAGVGQQIMAANPARTYLLLYSRPGVMAAAQNGAPSLNLPRSALANPYGQQSPPADLGTVFLGQGQALLQNGLTTPPATVWTGSVWVTCPIAGQRVFAMEG